MKIIKVKSCEICPFYGSCKAWTSLTRDQRVYLAIGISTLIDFILKDCHLEDEK